MKLILVVKTRSCAPWGSDNLVEVSKAVIGAAQVKGHFRSQLNQEKKKEGKESAFLKETFMDAFRFQVLKLSYLAIEHCWGQNGW